jgi:translocation and assembly module TamA
MGKVTFSGTEKVDTAYLQRRVPFTEGEPYDPAKVDLLRGKLTSLGTFNAVRIKPAATLGPNGELPIDVELTDRPQRSIGFGVSYETQLGFAINGFWVHRNLFGQAESLRLSAEINHIGQGLAIIDTGFAFGAAFRKPDWWLAGQDMRLEAAALREVLDAYTRNAVTAYAGIDRTISPHWQVRAGLAGEIAQITRNGITMPYNLIGLRTAALLNEADSDLDPTRGYRVQLDVTPWIDVGPGGDFFTIMRLTGRSYFDLSSFAQAEPGRTVLATRASFGTEPAISIGGIPPDKLFYAGGGGSVRGFPYQAVGPRLADNTPKGGTSLLETSLEVRRDISRKWSFAVFADGGAVGSSGAIDTGDLAFGAGVGVRYNLGLIPIRVDVATPVTRRRGEAPFQVYVSIGQSF